MADPARERLLPPALLLFLLGVALVLGWSVATRHPSPDLDGCIELLGDGDLDRDERERMLLRTIDLALQDETARGRMAGRLAALALQERAPFARLASAVDGLELSPEQRRWLDLGDPLLANVLEARLLEGAGDRARARTKWAQVAAQARMVGNGLATEQAAAAVERLR
jgi:hypothetical protein